MLISVRYGEQPMPNRLAHFAIEADHVPRARAFYEAVFGWRFQPWGPPDFYLIEGAGVHGALQQRAESLPRGRKGFECTIAVDDLDRSGEAVIRAGGEIIAEPVTIPGVGRLVQFCDTEGNEAIIMQYEPERLAEIGLASD